MSQRRRINACVKVKIEVANRIVHLCGWDSDCLGPGSRHSRMSASEHFVEDRPNGMIDDARGRISRGSPGIREMLRRELLLTVVPAPFAFTSLNARGQPRSSVRRIGALAVGPAPSPELTQRIWGPAQQLGWVFGENLVIERRYVKSADLLDAAANELVRLDVELIVTLGSAATAAAKQATARIPIVMGTVNDPVGDGFVASLARPGGNITGYSDLQPELDAKRIEFMKILLPRAGRVAVFTSGTFDVTTYSRAGLVAAPVRVRAVGDIRNAVLEAKQSGANAIVVLESFPYTVSPGTLTDSALEQGLPTVVADDSLVDAGALMALSVDEDEQFAVIRVVVDKILRGARPTEIPVQQPTRFVLAVNRVTARALRVTVPASLLQRADRVVG